MPWSEVDQGHVAIRIQQAIDAAVAKLTYLHRVGMHEKGHLHAKTLEEKNGQIAALQETVGHYRWHAENFAAIIQKWGSYASSWRKPYLVGEIERVKENVAIPFLHAEESRRAAQA